MARADVSATIVDAKVQPAAPRGRTAMFHSNSPYGLRLYTLYFTPRREDRQGQAQGAYSPALECGEGPVGMLEVVDQFQSTVRCLHLGYLYPTGRRRDGRLTWATRSAEFFVDLCFNVLVRPTRISPRQSGAAGPCSTLRGCTARPDRRLNILQSAAPTRTGPSP